MLVEENNVGMIGQAHEIVDMNGNVIQHYVVNQDQQYVPYPYEMVYSVPPHVMVDQHPMIEPGAQKHHPQFYQNMDPYIPMIVPPSMEGGPPIIELPSHPMHQNPPILLAEGEDPLKMAQYEVYDPNQILHGPAMDQQVIYVYNSAIPDFQQEFEVQDGVPVQQVGQEHVYDQMDDMVDQPEYGAANLQQHQVFGAVPPQYMQPIFVDEAGNIIQQGPEPQTIVAPPPESQSEGKVPPVDQKAMNSEENPPN